MRLKERLGGNLLWIPSTVLLRLGGVPQTPPCLTEWDFGTLGRGGNLFCNHTRLILGNGSSIRFWDNVWCGEMTLKEAFPVLYDIACDKDALIATHLVLKSESYQWDVSFFRAAHDWEVDVLTSFFTLLQSTIVDCEGEDQLCWSPSHKGKFDVRSFYKALACKEALHFPWKSFWWTKVPLKVAFFAWAATLGKILTLDNLRKMRVIVIDRYCICKMNVESVDHLLLHCEVARANLQSLQSVLGCLFGWQIYSLADGWVVALEVRLCRRWFIVTFCGACGGNVTVDSSRIKKEPLRSSFPLSFILCTLGRLCSSPLQCLVLMFSLFCFLLLLSRLSCIFSVYLIALCIF